MPKGMLYIGDVIKISILLSVLLANITKISFM